MRLYFDNHALGFVLWFHSVVDFIALLKAVCFLNHRVLPIKNFSEKVNNNSGMFSDCY